LTRFAIEEAYEFADAVETGRMQELCGELGDMLLQVVLNAEIARQDGRFSIEDVIEHLNRKMVRRHPHVFAGAKADTPDEVKANWQNIKNQEDGSKEKTMILPKALPALLVSHKLGEKSRGENFDWSSVSAVMDKVKEEWEEVQHAASHESKERQLEEIGDLLFSLAQLTRHLGSDAEKVLRGTNSKFVQRYTLMRNLITQDKKRIPELSTEEMESYWQRAKREIK